MVPDRGFVKQLKKLDPDYEVMWDWGAEKWEIWRVPKNKDLESCHITTIQTKNRTYRELGADVLLRLQAGDPTRFSLDQLCSYFDELDNQNQRRKRKDLKNKIEAIAKDTFNYARNVLQIQVPKDIKIGRVVGNE